MTKWKTKIPLERDIKKQIKDYLKMKGWIVLDYRSVGIKKKDGGYIPMTEVGVSDLICCTPQGRFVAIEVKRPGIKIKKDSHQMKFILRVRGKKGKAIFAHSLDDVIQKFGLE